MSPKRATLVLLFGMLLWLSGGSPLWSEELKTPAKPDPIGANNAEAGVPAIVGEKYELKDVAKAATQNRLGLNLTWILLTGYLVMFMQAGFAMVETGLTRGKNVAHTMAMNFMVYAVGMLGFWSLGFAIMFGGFGAFANLAGGELLSSEYSIKILDKEFGLFGYDGFFLTGNAFDAGLMALFLFQMVFMDTTATIPTGAMAERWKFFPFIIYAFFVSAIIYPVYGNWVWGGGWLAKLGSNFGLGHGHVDFAGSSVVHLVGGVTALAGALVLGPRLGKFNPDGTPNALPAHNVPMYMVGTFILAFGWFGFNPGSSLSGVDMNNARTAVNTMLASAGGAFASMIYMWVVYKKPDPSFMCNGMLAGLVAITAPCAFVTPLVAVLIGVIAGVLVIWSCLFVERVLKVDDPVGAVSVHGVNGAWGILALGLFADGTYGEAWNGSLWYKVGDKLQWFADKAQVPDGATAVGVTGLFYGNPSQFYAECLGIAANLVWVFPVAFVFFFLIEKTIGNRVSPEAELEGLDIPEMGVLGYITDDPKSPERQVHHPSAEPRRAMVPPDGHERYTIVIEGTDEAAIANAWTSYCQPGSKPASSSFLAVYPFMTTMQGSRFRFKGGEAQDMRDSLQELLHQRLPGVALRARIER